VRKNQTWSGLLMNPRWLGYSLSQPSRFSLCGGFVAFTPLLPEYYLIMVLRSSCYHSPMAYLLNRAEQARLMRLITINPDTGCWEWKGRLNSNGYAWAQRGPGHPPRVVHRIMWEHHHNTAVPAGMQLDHLCRVRNCVNPQHFEVVTPSENTRRQDHAERRKTHCPKGHPYDEVNTRHTKTGKRACRACDRERRKTSRTDVPGADVSPPPARGALGAGGGDTNLQGERLAGVS